MIKKLKLAAEFAGYGWDDKSNKPVYYNEKAFKVLVSDYRPDKELGRHWLVEILRKFDRKQYLVYCYKMIAIYDYENSEIVLDHWIQTAPSETCFECIMEVIKK